MSTKIYNKKKHILNNLKVEKKSSVTLKIPLTKLLIVYWVQTGVLPLYVY